MGAIHGECWYYLREASYKGIGTFLHLATNIPVSIILFLQLTPAIRRRFALFHRLSGYALPLALFGVVNGLLVTQHVFGNGLNSQFGAGLMGLTFIMSMVIAYINIKHLQIEKHRAWMFRG